MKKQSVILILAAILTSGLFADPVSPQNAAINPAYYANGHREFFELGLNFADVSVFNSYMSLPDMITLSKAKSYTFDFEKIFKEVGTGGLEYGFSLKDDVFVTIQVDKLALGGFLEQSSFFFSSVPQSFFGLLAHGNTLDQSISGSAPAYIQSFVKTGVFGSWKWENFTFGGKLGFFVPLAYAEDAQFSYNFLASSSGKITFDANAQFPMYTAIDGASLRNADGTMDSSKLTSSAITKALSSSAGFSLDAGVTYREPDTKKVRFGGALVNIPIAPATAKGKILYSGHTQYVVQDLMGNFNNPDLTKPTVSESSTTVSSVTKSIFNPMRINGFYRFSVLPFLDIIPEAEFVLWNPFRLNAGVTGEINLYDIIDLSLGLKRSDFFWKTDLGIALNFRVIELAVTASLTGPDLGSMFMAKGASAKVFLGMGF